MRNEGTTKRLSYLREHDEHVARLGSKFPVDRIRISSSFGTVEVQEYQICGYINVECLHLEYSYAYGVDRYLCKLCGSFRDIHLVVRTDSQMKAERRRKQNQEDMALETPKTHSAKSRRKPRPVEDEDEEEDSREDGEPKYGENLR